MSKKKMSKKEILIGAIEKASKNGWNRIIDRFDVSVIIEQMEKYKSPVDSLPYETILFDHSFAKALWGEDSTCGCGFKRERKSGECENCGKYKHEVDYWWHWEYHIQQLSLSKDRIKYIKDFI